MNLCKGQIGEDTRYADRRGGVTGGNVYAADGAGGLMKTSSTYEGKLVSDDCGKVGY